MLFIFSLIIFFLILCSGIYCIRFWNNDGFLIYGLLSILFSFVFLIISIGTVFDDISKTNILKAQNINMLPQSALETIYQEKVLQLQTVQHQIQKAFDKNQYQITVKNLNGISIYAMPMSGNGINFQGLGDIERGGAEKLKLLETLIEKQNHIATELIDAKVKMFREDYYKRNAEIMVYENSFFDGFIVRKFSIQNTTPLNVVENKVYFPNK